MEIPVTRLLDQRLAVEFVPWFEYSGIGKSGLFDVIENGAVIQQGYEPSSRTYQYGARVGVIWAY